MARGSNLTYRGEIIGPRQIYFPITVLKTLCALFVLHKYYILKNCPTTKSVISLIKLLKQAIILFIYYGPKFNYKIWCSKIFNVWLR